VDSEGTLWGVGNRIRGLGLSGASGYITKLFSKVPIYDVVPKAFQYTPTLTLENPNPDYGATIEFKNPNNRAFINLDDKTSNLRIGFVDNEFNAGLFKGMSISPSDNSVSFNQSVNFNGGGNVGIGKTNPVKRLEVADYRSTTPTLIKLTCQTATNPGESNTTIQLSGTSVGSYGGYAEGYLIQGVGSGLKLGNIGNSQQKTEIMRLVSSGNVGIGKTNPSCTLDINDSTSQFNGIFSNRLWVANVGDNSGDGSPDDNTGSPWRGLGFDNLAWNDQTHKYSGDIPILSG
jgi:hypothetical protein